MHPTCAFYIRSISDISAKFGVLEILRYSIYSYEFNIHMYCVHIPHTISVCTPYVYILHTHTHTLVNPPPHTYLSSTRKFKNLSKLSHLYVIVHLYIRRLNDSGGAPRRICHQHSLLISVQSTTRRHGNCSIHTVVRIAR